MKRNILRGFWWEESFPEKKPEFDKNLYILKNWISEIILPAKKVLVSNCSKNSTLNTYYIFKCVKLVIQG